MTASPQAATLAAPAAPATRRNQPATGTDEIPNFSHREILEILSGLLIALFVTNVAGTITSTALPTITAKLGANGQQYMWVVTSTLLASTASTPIWGKLADLFDKKKLVIAGLAVFTIGSALSGAATSPGFLICSRAIQGVGLGCMMALSSAIIGSVIPPRQRGRYMAYTGAVMAVATVAGPLIGGFIVDISWLGWRWCFWSAVPWAILAMIVLNWRLRVPKLRREGARVDWLGATLITVAACSLLIWISFVTKDYDYVSWQTFALLGFTALATVGFVITEHYVHDPIIPMPIIKMRVTALAIVASIAVGVAMFGASVFLSQYYQLGRGMSPTKSGLMTIPLMVGVLISSVVIGQLISRLGVWKPFVVAGSFILAAGLYGLSFLHQDTSLVRIGAVMVVTGLGVGMMMQNLVLAVQNSVSVRDVGSATGMVTFFRSLGGAIGIQSLGLVFQNHLTNAMSTGMKQLATQAITADVTAGGNPGLAQTCQTLLTAPSAAVAAQCPQTAELAKDVSTLAASGGTSMDVHGFGYQPFVTLLTSSIGNSIGHLFLIGAIISVVSIIAVIFMKGTRLRAKFNMAASASDQAHHAGPVSNGYAPSAESAQHGDKAGLVTTVGV
jgi:EmrB/QacA subfamily drug resistance transporter